MKVSVSLKLLYVGVVTCLISGCSTLQEQPFYGCWVGDVEETVQYYKQNGANGKTLALVSKSMRGKILIISNSSIKVFAPKYDCADGHILGMENISRKYSVISRSEDMMKIKWKSPITESYTELTFMLADSGFWVISQEGENESREKYLYLSNNL